MTGMPDRLASCNLCGQALTPSSELFLLNDAAYCCSSHRTQAAAVERAAAKGDAKARHSPLAVRAPTPTGVGLAASHRSWFSLDDLSQPDPAASMSAASSPSAPLRRLFSRRRRESAPEWANHGA
jgi:hypothetical protein